MRVATPYGVFRNMGYSDEKLTEYRILHSHAEKGNFSSSVDKCFTNERSERVQYFSTLEEKFYISPIGLFIISTPMKY